MGPFWNALRSPGTRVFDRVNCSKTITSHRGFAIGGTTRSLGEPSQGCRAAGEPLEPLNRPKIASQGIGGLGWRIIAGATPNCPRFRAGRDELFFSIASELGVNYCTVRYKLIVNKFSDVKEHDDRCGIRRARWGKGVRHSAFCMFGTEVILKHPRLVAKYAVFIIRKVFAEDLPRFAQNSMANLRSVRTPRCVVTTVKRVI